LGGREISAMNIFEEFPRIFSKISEGDIKYALVGGVAMSFHDTPRFTKDIDILFFPEDMEKLKKIDKVFKELSSLYELNRIINTYKIR
jgi:hypothetical protein